MTFQSKKDEKIPNHTPEISTFEKVRWKFLSISLVFYHVVPSTESFHVAQHELNYVEVANVISQKGEFQTPYFTAPN